MRRSTLLLLSLCLLIACGSADPTNVGRSDPTVEPTSTIPTLSQRAASDIQMAIIDDMMSKYPFDYTTAEVDAPLPLYEWAESAPEAQGMNRAKLDEMPIYITDAVQQIHSVLVVRNGTLVYEYYKDGREAESADVVWSVTKSITSLLIGIAIDEGLLTVEQTLGEILTAQQLADSDPALATITVRDLLTMTSGISCRNDDCHDDTLATVLADELSDPPSTTFAYDTGASHLLSAVLEQVTGMPPHDYAAKKLFIPLGIVPPPWEIDDDGNTFGGKGIAMFPRDMAKLGQLLLDEGVWDGERLISAEYIAEATQNQIADVSDTEYGYLFWMGDAGGYETFSAIGFGGQYITVVPELELVITITSDFFPPKDGSDSIIEPFIIAAVQE